MAMPSPGEIVVGVPVVTASSEVEDTTTAAAEIDPSPKYDDASFSTAAALFMTGVRVSSSAFARRERD